VDHQEEVVAGLYEHAAQHGFEVGPQEEGLAADQQDYGVGLQVKGLVCLVGPPVEGLVCLMGPQVEGLADPMALQEEGLVDPMALQEEGSVGLVTVSAEVMRDLTVVSCVVGGLLGPEGCPGLWHVVEP
jgi:hypothetical protein